MNHSDAMALEALLDDAGYRIEGPGGPSDGELRGRYWWTLSRDGWSGVECGPDFPSAKLAVMDAVEALLNDEDLDWNIPAVMPEVADQFPPDFPARMAQALTPR